jgi:hypothetical protein
MEKRANGMCVPNSMEFISDLQRNFMPLPDAFLQGMEPTDQFLLAYPRSGSRWLMRLLSDLANAAFGLEDCDFNLGQGWRAPVGSEAYAEFMNKKRTIPDVHVWGRESSTLLPLGRRPIFRSHHLCEVLTRCTGPIVYVVREAVPMLHSYYHFARQRKTLAEHITLDEFCMSHLPLWKDHVSTMLALHEVCPGRVHFVTYRDPGPFLPSQVASSAAHFGIPFEPETIDWALGRMAELLARLNAQPDTLHARGENRAVIADFPPELRDWVVTETQALFEQVRCAEEAGLRT